ncbi:ABC transporter ATP-binding protein [Virgibacillus soli]|uniref:ABC transporter ATP-binding protein n=1 Tax=Lederbergia galactosidilytica TaxID=217031 RepID=A0A0Q9YIS9_9BACI|nr:ABC transporter ATP-binding protein [Lederbergia galactosidilytica]KRG14878.1 ABC transporter ATP-binding protein [Virgibacillus soli]KRG16926.1 ABC transporter ATP-binding protein [Lederbergia galactosidilytica]MBP1914557.1 ABC-2 type transport system ATP-binding protein [Lederbergia galactosidilytica]
MIQVQNLHKSYKGNSVLRGVDFKANKGEIIGVIGKNGAGKSTFLEIIMTLKNYDEGEVTVFGQDLQKLTEQQHQAIRANISAVLQPTQFFKNLKVEELLHLFKAYYRSNTNIEQIIKDFQLESHRKTYFEKLSGGWKQKISLAVAFLSNPKLIILDEPTTGLDPHMRNTLWTYITEYNQKTNGTVILTTHYMDEVEMYCDKVLLINDGKAELFTTPKNILALGYSSINDFYLQNVL